MRKIENVLEPTKREIKKIMYGTLREWSAAQRHKLKFFREKYLKMYYNIRTDKKRKKLEKNN